MNVKGDFMLLYSFDGEYSYLECQEMVDSLLSSF
jgi:hypothetical protein